MDATYTKSELITFAYALQIGIEEQLTAEQQAALGPIDPTALAKEVMDFLARDFPTMEAVEAAAAKTSTQIHQLVDFGILSLTAGY